MSREERMNDWFHRHNVTQCGDKVYDGLGVVTLIDKGDLDYEIRIQPLYFDHNLGNGCGATVFIRF